MQQPAEQPITASEIYGILADHPKSLVLYQKVQSYFGNSLKIVKENRIGELSGVGLFPPSSVSDFAPLIFTLRLVVDHKAPAALTHELLHLQLKMDGFSMPVPLHPLPGEVAAYSVRAAMELWKQFSSLGNVLNHEIFFPDFVACGFNKDQMFPDSRCTINLVQQKQVFEVQLMLKDFVKLSRGIWCIVYFCQCIEQERGFENKADDMFVMGETLFPDTATADKKWFSEWFEKGEFRKPEQYADCFRQLVRRPGLPVPLLYCIERKEGQIIPVFLAATA